MRVLVTGAASACWGMDHALEFCGLRLDFFRDTVMFRPLTQNEKRQSVSLLDPIRAFPFAHWTSMCTRERKFATLIGALHRLWTHTSHDVCLEIALQGILTELQRADYPESWLSRGIFTMASSRPLTIWGRLAMESRTGRGNVFTA